ncbi:MAG TPA: GGDEF domain-containing protein [Candidatus Limnocylindria bacterium]|jgi:diguanylate cyclase (GGDEF)-like protein|nr:GGDEF domain-containing protein [Candidatus Limnocylindria bacterium]
MLRSELTAAIARAVGTGLALALPAAAVAALRLFPPLTLDPAGETGWLGPAALGLVALCSAISVVPLMGGLVTSGRLATGSAGLSATALTAGTAALALSGPEGSASLPNSGLALTLVVVAVGFAVAAWAGYRTIADERSRWMGVILALVLAETALAAALLAPGSALDSITPMLFMGAAVVAAASAAVWFRRGARLIALAPVTVALAAVLLTWSRTGTVEAVIALTPLLLAPPLLVAGFAIRAQVLEVVSGLARDSESAPVIEVAAAATPLPPADDPERERIGRELRAALIELTDARHTIALQRTELERAAEADALTGVLSRSAITDRLRDEVASARRYPHSVSVVLMDVDGMGEINARHGTAIGDDVLRELALRIRVRVREADALGRMAGDSFLAVLPHTDEQGATVFAEAIRDRATQRPISTGRGEVTVTISIGVTTMRSRQELSADTLLARADEAVASARAGGGNVIAYDRLHGLARLDERRRETPTDEEPLEDNGEA